MTLYWVLSEVMFCKKCKAVFNALTSIETCPRCSSHNVEHLEKQLVKE